MIRRFSTFAVSAALVKLKLPVITVFPSMTIILLWAMACLESMNVGILALVRNVADV